MKSIQCSICGCLFYILATQTPWEPVKILFDLTGVLWFVASLIYSFDKNAQSK